MVIHLRLLHRAEILLRNGVDAPEPEGVELPDLVAAQQRAIADARFTIAETIKEEQGHASTSRTRVGASWRLCGLPT